MNNFKSIILQQIDEVESFFINTDVLAVIILDTDLKISTHNKYFRKLISSGEKVTGKSIYSFLLPESQDILPLSDSIKKQSVWLNFKSSDSSPMPLMCHIVKNESGEHIIFGGHLMLTNDQNIQKMTVMSNEMANMARDLNRKNKELIEAQSKIKTLSGIIPICMHCKEIRDDKGYWNQLEAFITEHSEAEFSHGICDKCLEKYYPE